ncbi:MAG: LysR substrate-binding domain-containing protein [Azospira sp.]|jgi:LysR family hydrogen peroxide-inducible transcriptional activator|nr:LysR substrate-binding domain-containing protein [Azospira sp.]
MTLTELRYIVALAQEGNFSRAAERCSVSQPTLSVAIARLEDELGVPLFERGKGFVGVTSVGEQVIEQARVALQEAEKVRQVALAGRDPLDGPLRLGVIHTVGPYLLPQLICALKEIAPNMPLLIEENMTANLSDMLCANELDVIIIALPFNVPGVLVRALYDESFMVVVPRGHHWASLPALGPDEIDGEEMLLLKAGNCFRDQVLGACPQVSTPESDVRLGHTIGTIRCMVASGLGVSVLPEGALGQPYNNELISAIPFREPAPSRRIALAWRPGFARPKAIDALLDAVRAIDSPAYRHVS